MRTTSPDSPLSPFERKFIAEYFRNGFRIGKAYGVTKPEVDTKTCYEQGSRLLMRIKAKTAEWEKILKLAELDDFRLAVEVRKKLRARKVEFYQGAKVTVVQDNGTQMRAVELLADLLGRRKMALPVGESGEALTGVLMVPVASKSAEEWEAEGGAGGATPAKST